MIVIVFTLVFLSSLGTFVLPLTIPSSFRHRSLARPRQVASSETSSNSSSSGNTNTAIPLSAIIAISVILGVGIAITLIFQFRARQRRNRARQAETIRATSLVSLTAEDLASAGSSESSRRRNGATSSTVVGNGAPAGNGRRGRRSRGRALRRTESGRSVKTLPEYSKEAGDEELVLVRRKSGSTAGDYEYQHQEDIREEEEEGNGVDMDESQEMINTQTVPISIRPASPSVSRSHSDSPSGDLADASIPIVIHSAPLLGTSSNSESENDNDHNHDQSMETLQTQGWGEAPTYLEAMSSHNPDAPRPPQVPAPKTSALQRTASGFRDLLTKPFAPGSFRLQSTSTSTATSSTTPPRERERQRWSTSSASLLHPTTSRFSTASTEYPSPWASSHSLLISPPVPNTAMRASFDGSDIPKSGLNPAQMKFLSSKEAVELVGVKLEDVPAHKRKGRRPSDVGLLASGSRRGSDQDEEAGNIPPPTWESLEGERRRSEAFERRNLATPVKLPEEPSTTETESAAAEATASPPTNTPDADMEEPTITNDMTAEVSDQRRDSVSAEAGQGSGTRGKEE